MGGEAHHLKGAAGGEAPSLGSLLLCLDKVTKVRLVRLG